MLSFLFYKVGNQGPEQVSEHVSLLKCPMTFLISKSSHMLFPLPIIFSCSPSSQKCSSLHSYYLCSLRIYIETWQPQKVLHTPTIPTYSYNFTSSIFTRAYNSFPSMCHYAILLHYYLNRYAFNYKLHELNNSVSPSLLWPRAHVSVRNTINDPKTFAA